MGNFIVMNGSGIGVGGNTTGFFTSFRSTYTGDSGDDTSGFQLFSFSCLTTAI